MDDDLFSSPSRSSGGAVEPARQAPTAGPAGQGPGERFELRDRVAGVTHRATAFSEMVARAEQLGSTLFVAVAPDGRRTSIQKVDGEWQRGPQRPASTATRVEPGPPVTPGPARPLVPALEPEAAGVQPMPPAPKMTASTEPVDAGARPRLEAKAERALLVARLEAALVERYIIRPAPVSIGNVSLGRTEYRFRGDSSRVAFTESNLRLATDINSPSVARSMVDVAQARGWRGLRVSGHEDFKRMAWLEASVRGLKALGYEPSPQDLAQLEREREARLLNRIEPAADVVRSTAAAAQGGGGRKSVLAAVQALLVAHKVPEGQRAAVMAAATEKLAQLSSQGEAPRVRIYDKAAPSRPVAMPAPAMQRAPGRTGPAPVR